MGNGDSKLNFRKAVVELTSKTQVIYELCFSHGNSDTRDVLFTVLFERIM